MPQNGYQKFIKGHKVQGSGKEYTNTIIPGTEFGVYGASLNICDEEYAEFCNLYCKRVFEHRQPEYMTEKQLIDASGEYGPILIDLDFRYPSTITERQHTNDDIQNIIYIYLESLTEIINFTDGTFSVYVFEKANVNILSDKNITKDGIHIIIGIKMSHEYQRLLRVKVLEKLPTELDEIPITNTWSDVIDEGITQGSVGWQMYGSKKPGNQAYKMTQHLEYTYSEETNDFQEPIQMDDKDNFKSMPHFIKISARFTGNPEFTIKDEAVCEVANKFKKRAPRILPVSQSTPVLLKQAVVVDYAQIDNIEKLEQQVELWKKSLSGDGDYRFKEIYDLIMILPEEYYGEGSYNKWIKVGFAMKSMGDKMLLPWLRFCARSSVFDFADIPERISDWQTYNNNDSATLTELSIIYWARMSNKEEFDKVRSDTLSQYIDESINENTDYSVALVIHCKYKFEFVCVSAKHNIWYRFVDNIWKLSDIVVLQDLVPSEIFKIYTEKTHELTHKKLIPLNEAKRVTEDPVELERLKDEIKKVQDSISTISKITRNLRMDKTQKSIMSQARIIFYDSEFLAGTNKNVYLLAFTNGIYDFEAGEFREGRADDYITLSTNKSYQPPQNIHNYEIIKGEIAEFMTQLFPDSELCEYMWEHLSSVLLGINHNQTFNIYNGGGSNGKSLLVDLMSEMLGDYKGVVPTTLITQKRNEIGKASPEIYQLIGRRYAVIQEPQKGDSLNEGIMKEITGGDPLQGRALFKDTVTFIPQFKLVVCTNNLFDIKSNDDGTWRRIRVCKFKSKFVDQPDYTPDIPYLFLKNKNLKSEKFKIWVPVLMNMLIERVTKNKGIIEDCREVTEASNSYRNEQDYIARFISEKVREVDDKQKCIKKRALGYVFRQWYQEQTGKQAPKLEELYSVFEKRFGPCGRQGWINLTIEEESTDNNIVVET
tara:strand:+ start:4760 stop:7570 length:2811 start_codon:yes stop_codon:yes gene_type:complete